MSETWGDSAGEPGSPPNGLPDEPYATYNPLLPFAEFFGAAEEVEDSLHLDTDETLRDNEGAASSPAGAPECENFTLLSKVNQGGYGEIWEALQISLGRTVALKRLRPELATRGELGSETQNKIVGGMRQEAIVTALLEHPNIVPVHDLVHVDGGQPMIAMKMVKGSSWSRMLQNDFTRLSVPDFLARHVPILVSVSQAVAFAHSRGIIHRDLKPGQVMVGEFGEVLLMDWGLAVRWKEFQEPADAAFGRDRIPTTDSAPSPAGTAAYMAPEQTLSSAAKIGPWTDVYLLGATLYQLLTGVPPHYTKTAQASFFHASEGRVTPAAELNPQREVPALLAALADRALAKSPGDRVASAREFLEGLQEYLTGTHQRQQSLALLDEARTSCPDVRLASHERLVRALPVLEKSLGEWPANTDARTLHESITGRLAALARRRSRRRHLFITAGALTLTVLGMLHAWQSNRLRLQAELSRDQAIRAANTMVNELAGGMANMVGAQTESARNMVLSAQQVFDDLSDEATGDELIASGRANALISLSIMWQKLGGRAESIAAIERAIATSEEWLARTQDPGPWLLLLTRAHNQRGIVLLQMHNYEGAGESVEASVAAAGRALDLDPRNFLYRYWYARMLLRRTNMPFTRREDVHPREMLEQARAILLELQREAPEDGMVLHEIANVSHDLASMYMFSGRMPEAVPLFEERIAAYDRLHEQDPGDARWALGTVSSRSALSESLLQVGDTKGAEEHARAGLAAGDALVATDAQNLDYRYHRNIALQRVGRGVFAQGRLDEAEEILVRALHDAEALQQADPLNNLWRDNLYFLIGNLGDLRRAQGDLEGSIAEMTRGRDMVEAALEAEPDNFLWKFRWVDATVLMARTIGADPARREEVLAILDEAEARLRAVEQHHRLTREQKDLFNVINESRALLNPPAEAAEPELAE